MKLSRWVPLAVTGVIGFGSFLNGYLTFNSERALFDELRAQECKQLIQETHNSLDETGARAAAFAATVAAMPGVVKHFENKNRESLLAETLPVFNVLKEKYRVQVLQFHEPRLVTFLRTHKPEHFDDDLSHRELVVSANQKKNSQYGVEAGTSGVALRGITTVGTPEKHIGTLEAGIAFEPVVQSISTRTGFQLGIYIENAKVEKMEGRSTGKFKEVAVTDSDLLAKAVPQGGVDIIQDDFIKDETIDGVNYSIVEMPLLDVSNQNIGTIVALKAFTGLAKKEHAVKLRAILQCLLLTILGAGVVAAVFKGLYLAPVAALGHAVREREEQLLDTFVSRDDELGDLAKAIKERE